jgi:ABC-type proline/glycine betaine transport system substrate-binding protein
MRKRLIWLICVLALLSVNALAAPQAKTKKAATKASHKQVTITLVRWPYT